MPDHVIGTVMRSLSEITKQFAGEPSPLILVASSGQESTPPVSRYLPVNTYIHMHMHTSHVRAHAAIPLRLSYRVRMLAGESNKCRNAGDTCVRLGLIAMHAGRCMRSVCT